MEVGSRMHLIAEQFITRIVTIIGNSNYGNVMYPIYNEIINQLKKEPIFLANDKNIWLNVFYKTIEKFGSLFEEQLKEAASEAIQTIWQVSKENKKSNFVITQEREILKRTFFRFLLIEKKQAENSEERLTAIERERPITIKLSGLNLSGKIDRIDATQFGLQIIDYKTSNISKTEKKISLFPSELSHAKTSKLSVQGALYCLAWSHHKLLKEEEGYRNQIKSFSLYHLKNLDENADPILNYEFENALIKDNTHYQNLFNEYSIYAEKLKSGDFYPKPIKSNTCGFCDFKSICPLSVADDSDDNTNEDSI